MLPYSLLRFIVFWHKYFMFCSSYRREVIVTSSVLTCEVVKVNFLTFFSLFFTIWFHMFTYIYLLITLQVICALILMAKEGTLKKIYREWTLFGSLTASGLPAAIYALQNSLLQISYKNLDSLTFSILNQTKLFFTALFTYMILRYAFAGWLIVCWSEFRSVVCLLIVIFFVLDLAWRRLLTKRILWLPLATVLVLRLLGVIWLKG